MKALYKYTVLLGFVLFFITKSHAQSLPTSYYGIWDRGDGIQDYSDPKTSFVLGIETMSLWEDIQPTGPNSWDFSYFQQELDQAVANDKLIRFSVNVGPESPLWLFDNGVPLVHVLSNAPKNDKYADRYPYYLDADYKTYYFAMIEQFALFLRNQPQEKFNHIAFVQVKTGSTGDEEAYKGDAIIGAVNNNIDYTISPIDWENFRIECFGKFKQYFNDVSTRKIVLTFNNIDPITEPDAYNWVMNTMDPAVGFGMKGGAFNRGHHLNDEQTYKEQWTPYLINPHQDAVNTQGLKLFAASEMDQSWTKGYFAFNYEIGFYWAALGGLNTGVSCTNVSANAMQYALDNPGIIETFKMYNRYAQQVYPQTATTAFSILHEGLNSADTQKFPTGTYGSPANQSNVTRYQNICNSTKYYNRGARMDEPSLATFGQVYQRENQLGYNDAGWEIAEGNIERFMTQITPDDTSIGLFRVRGPLTASSSKYDRFARSFENSTGRNTMYFKLDSQLQTSNKDLKFVITWLDKTAGSTWAFKYRNASGLQSVPFTGSGTNEWRTDVITLSDAIINQGGTLGSDFMLVNTDTVDDIFNGIEMNILQAQTINFDALPTKKVGDADFYPGATSNSRELITYTSSNTNVATIVNNKIHIVGTGSCTITASLAGNNYYYAAPSVSQHFSVVVETQTTITTSGSWTRPTGINTIKVEACGGGGGGGGTSLAGFAGGGAGGSYVINDSVTVGPATSYSVTIGAGGALSATGSGADGYNGSNTTFASATPVIAFGGAGGKGTNSAGQLGAGGTNSSGGSGGSVTLGSPGTSGATGSGGAGGKGAGDLGGAGGASKTSAGNGLTGTAPGGAGGGAYGNSGVNRGGAGGAGQVIITYSVGVPNAPTIGTATVSGVSGRASIPFTAPTFNGNATITSYTATSSPGGITATVSQAGSGTIIMNGLTNGKAYTFTVRATNSIGQSAESAASNEVTPYTVPDAPTIGTATLNNVNGQAIISFTAPTFNGGSPITSYVATSSPGGITGTLSQAGSGSITVNGLSDGTTYTFTIKAVNAAGSSAASGTSNALVRLYKTPQTITFGTLSAVTYGDAVISGATASSGLPVTYSSNNPSVATTSGSTITVVGAGSAIITASQAGDSTYAVAPSVTQTLVVNKKPLSITAPSIASKVYNSLPASGVVTPGTLSGFVGSETVTATATGLYVNANVGTAKSATITYTLSDGTNGGKADNYSLASGTAEGTITQAPLTITGVIANNKVEDGNTTATLSALGSLSGFFAADAANVILNSASISANFDTATVGAAKPVTITGYTITGSASANYSLSQPTGITANIASPATITAEGATTFCSGGSVTLSANTGTGLTYLWSTGATTPSIAVTTSGSYTVTVTSIGGNATSLPTTVTVNPNTTNGSVTTSICAGDSYTWPLPNGTGLIYTTAQINLTNVVGCNTARLNLTVSPTPASAGSNGSLVICAGSSVDATALYAALIGTPAPGGTWSAETGGAGTYTYTQAATSPCKVDNTATVTVTEQAKPNAGTNGILSLSASPSEAALFAAITGEDAGGTWTSPGSGYVGVYTYTVNATLPCTENDTSTVTVTPATLLPTPDTTYNLCAGTKISGLLAAATSNGSVGVKVYAAATGGSPIVLSGTTDAVIPTSTTPKAYWLTEPASTPSGESARVRVFALVNALPATPSALVLTNDNAVLPAISTTAVTAVGVFVGTNAPFKLTATAVGAVSYKWTLPTGVVRTNSTGITTDSSTTSTDAFIYVKFSAYSSTTPTPLVINVQSVNAAGCTSAIKASASLTRLLPTAPSALAMNNGLNTTAITTFAKYMGSPTVLRLSATAAVTATSYLWELPTGVNRMTSLEGGSVTTDLTSTDPFIFVNFAGVTKDNTDTNSAVAVLTKVLRIGVKSVNGVGSSTTVNSGLLSTAKLLTLTAVAPAAPASLAMNNGANTTAITVISKMIGQGATVKLLAATSVLASSYAWELPACVTRVTDLGGATADNTSTSTDPFIFVKFNGINPAAGSIYFGVTAVNGVGSSVTNNSASTVIPATSSTAKLLKLVTAVPAAPTALALNNGANATAITVISKLIGQGVTYRLSATVPTTTLANSFTWELPACVTRVTDLGGLTSDNTSTSTNPEIFVKFNGINPAAGSIYFGVKAVNNVGPSYTNNQATTLSPVTSSTAMLLKLVTAVPAAPATLVLNDVNKGPSTTAVAVVSKYIGTSTKLKLTAGVSVLANTYEWTLPEGVNRVDESGNFLLGTSTTEPFIYVNFLNVPHETTTISLVFGVKAVNGVGSSSTKTLTVTAGVPSVVATVTGLVSVCDRSQGYDYTITAPAGATYYTITAPLGSIVSSVNGVSGVTKNILTTPDLTFNVIYSGTSAFPTTDKTLSIKSGNDFGTATAKVLVLLKVICPLPAKAEIVSSDEFKVVAYPNPYASTFQLNFTTTCESQVEMRVYDMTGRLIERREVRPSDMVEQQIGDRYPSGVYNVVVTQSEEVKTLRMIKK